MLKLIIIFLLTSATFAKESFRGWEDMKVIKSDRGEIYVDDYLHNGQSTLMLINHTQGRLDFYRYQTSDERDEPEISESPNELPMAEEFKLTELPIPRPIESVKNIVLGDTPGLLIQTLYPDQLNFYKKTSSGWKEEMNWKLIPDEFQGLPILIKNNNGTKTALIAAKKGIQTIQLEKNSRVKHLEPVDVNVNRIWWWHLDVNGDGLEDIVEWVSGKLRLIKNSKENGLLPATELHEEGFSHAEIGKGSKGAEFYLISNEQENLLGHYKIKQDEDVKKFGKKISLPLEKIKPELKTSLILDGKETLLIVDSNNALFKLFTIDDQSWKSLKTYPAMRNIESICAVPGEEGIVLIKQKDGQTLFYSKWENNRLSYPKVFDEDNILEDQSILRLERTGKNCWWVIRKGNHLELNIWNQENSKAKKVLYKDLGNKVEEVNWLGNDRIIYRQKYRQEVMYAKMTDGTLKKVQLKNLKKASLSEFSFIEINKESKPVRLVGGILTWLDDKLSPIDQINLPNAGKIRSYVQVSDNEAMALDQSGKNVHVLKKDKSGIYRSIEEHEIMPSNSLFLDPIFGLSCQNNRSLTLVSEGSSEKLILQKSIDKRILDVQGIKKINISDYRLMDVTGNNQNDLLVMDYPNRRLSLLEFDKNKKAEKTLSWTVFDDKKYPYGGGRKSQDSNSQPQEVISADFDKDGKMDLVMMCHDRIIFYLAKKETK